MKTRLFLLITLVLLAVQGWAIVIEPDELSFPNQAVGMARSKTFKVIETVTTTSNKDQIYSFDGLSNIKNVKLSDPYNFFIQEGITNVQIERVHNYSVGDEDQYDYYLYVITFTTEWTVIYKPLHAGTHSASVIFEIKSLFDLFNEQEEVKLEGTAVEPVISTNTPSLNFPCLNIDDTKTIPLEIKTDVVSPLTLELSDTAMFSIDKNNILASETGTTVYVTYKPNVAGNHTSDVIIKGFGSAQNIVPISGSAVKPLPSNINVNPTLLPFSTVVVGDYKTATFIVQGDNFTSDLDLSLTGASGFSINKTIITPSEAASGHTIKVTYKPTAAGTHTAKITIRGGGTNDIKTVSMTGTAIVRKITTDKSALTFSSQTVGKAVSKTFKITGTNLTGNVTVKLNDKTGMYSIDRTTGETGTSVKVTYKPTASSSSHIASITLTGGGALEEKTISLSGSAVVRKITTNALNMTFYSTPVNQSVTKNLTVTGTNLPGSMTVKLNDATGMYSITPKTLPASGGTVKVTYEPTVKGSHSASITISGGDAFESKTVYLKGTAVVPTITVSPSSLSFTQGDASKSFTVKGSNLTGNLSLTLSGSSIFILGKSSITPSQAASGISISVGCIPKNATSASATITISGGGASKKTVTLSYRKSSGVVSISAVEPEGGDEDGNEEFMDGGTLEIIENSTTDVNELAMSAKVYAECLNIIIETPIEQKALISDIAGHVREVNLQSGRNEIPVNANGIYIVRIREKTTKLMLK